VVCSFTLIDEDASHNSPKVILWTENESIGQFVTMAKSIGNVQKNRLCWVLFTSDCRLNNFLLSAGMDAKSYIEMILEDEGLTGDLDQVNSQKLIDYIIAKIESFQGNTAVLEKHVSLLRAWARKTAKAACSADNQAIVIAQAISQQVDQS
jgi:hypothetical protein